MGFSHKLMLNSSTGSIVRETAGLFDGIANLRSETFFLATTGSTIGQNLGSSELVKVQKKVSKKLKEICEIFYPKPVWYRTIDTDPQLARKALKSQRQYEVAHLPLRGLKLSLYFPELLAFELRLVFSLCKEGISNLGIKFPFVSSSQEIQELQQIMKDIDIPLDLGLGVGITIETPSAALQSDEFVKCGIRFVTVGINDMAALTLGIDRENLPKAGMDYFSEPAIMQLVKNIPSAFLKSGTDCILSGVGIPSDAALRCGISFFSGIAVDFANPNLVSVTRKRIMELQNE